MSSSPPKPKLSWRKKLLFSVVTVVSFFLALELLLALLGVQPARETRDPFVGFQPGVPLYVRQDDHYETNELKLTFFNRESFPAAKSKTAYRVFCLGESTTYGHPYDARMSYTSWLRANLNEADPKRDWQVVNCGGISYASYRLAVLTEELVNYQPDLFIIYVGHNEFLEERSYRDVRQRPAALSSVWQLASYSRTAGLIGAGIDRLRPAPEPLSELNAEVDTILERSDGPQSYSRDETLRAGVLAHYRFSLEKMIALAKRAGARVILVQPASNVRNFSPFKSQAGDLGDADLRKWSDLAAAGRQAARTKDYARACELFDEANQLDPQNARGWWLAGQAYLAAGNYRQAQECLVRAKDEDVCPLRALSEIEKIITDVAASQHVELIDFPALLKEKCRQELGHEILGLESFLDHVHPSTDAHAELGRALFERMAALRLVSRAPDSEDFKARVRERVTSTVTPYDHGMALQTLAMTLSWTGKNDEALRISDEAVKALPENCEVVSQHGRLLEKAERLDEALADYEKAVALDPNYSLARSRLGNLLMRREDFAPARTHLIRAVETTPERAPLGFRVGVLLSLGECELALGNTSEAQRQFQAALALDPSSDRARENLAKANGK